MGGIAAATDPRAVKEGSRAAEGGWVKKLKGSLKFKPVEVEARVLEVDAKGIPSTPVPVLLPLSLRARSSDELRDAL